MNIFIAYTVLLILVLLIIKQIKVWKWRCLLSPGFYFGLLWSFGVFGAPLFSVAGYLPLIYPEYLNELNILVGYTGLCFLILTKNGRERIPNKQKITLNFIPKKNVLTIISLILFITALYAFISNGANFNMGQARVLMHKTEESQSTLIGYVQTLSLPLSICYGYLWGRIYASNYNMSNQMKIISLLPLLSNFLFSLYLGGRVNLIYTLLQYVIGFCLYIPIYTFKKTSKKIFASLIIGAIIVSSFISAVAAQRQGYYGGTAEQFKTINKNNMIMEILYGPIEYMTASYLGYQFRN